MSWICRIGFVRVPQNEKCPVSKLWFGSKCNNFAPISLFTQEIETLESAKHKYNLSLTDFPSKNATVENATMAILASVIL